MQRFSVACALVAASIAATGAAQTRPAPSDQQILEQLERDWDRAFLRKDLGFIENVLADDVVVVDADGSRGDKARELRMVAEFDQQIDSSMLDEFTIKVNGETAVVFFTRRLVGPKQGRPAELTFRYIDVFAWRAGRWQCVATQSVKVEPEP